MNHVKQICFTCAICMRLYLNHVFNVLIMQLCQCDNMCNSPECGCRQSEETGSRMGNQRGHRNSKKKKRRRSRLPEGPTCQPAFLPAPQFDLVVLRNRHPPPFLLSRSFSLSSSPRLRRGCASAPTSHLALTANRGGRRWTRSFWSCSGSWRRRRARGRACGYPNGTW